MKKTFPLRTILTVTTGRLLTKSRGERDNGISDLYEFLGWMTNDQPFTHQLGRFATECKPWLLRWFPELAEASNQLPQLDCLRSAHDSVNQAIDEWLELCVQKWGMNRTYEVEPIPRDDHDFKNAYDELVEIRGTDEGIVVVDSDRI